jgi:hypothetical protein
VIENERGSKRNAIRAHSETNAANINNGPQQYLNKSAQAAVTRNSKQSNITNIK